MKILHTSDWHIGQLFYRYERDDEHRHFFAQLCRIVSTERPDAMLVSGDVFHNPAPSTAAMRLFVDGVLAVQEAAPDMHIVIIAGNHDSGTRLEAERKLWQRANIDIVGSCHTSEMEVQTSHYIYPIGDKGYVVAVPYCYPSNYPQVMPDIERDERGRAFFAHLMAAVPDDERAVVLMAHLAVKGCDMRCHDEHIVGGMQSESIETLGCGYDYLALGHIHAPQRIDQRAYYSGSALPVSFSEDFAHSVNIVEIDRRGCMPTVRQITVEALREVKTIPEEGASFDEALSTLQALDERDNAYIRLLVDQDTPLPADAEDRANRMSHDKQCRLCDVVLKPRQRAARDTASFEVQSVDELRTHLPIDIARHHYEKTHNAQMNDALAALMQQAIDRVASQSAAEK